MTHDSMTHDSRPVWRSYLTHLECTACGLRHDADQLQTVCTACGKVLFARYDLNSVRQAVMPREFASRRWEMWRYWELLPVRDAANVISLGEGLTPLVRVRKEATRKLGFERGQLELKDEGLVSDVDTRSGHARGGRPGVQLVLRNPSRIVVGIDFGHSHVAIAVADLGHNVLAEHRSDLDVNREAGRALDVARGDPEPSPARAHPSPELDRPKNSQSDQSERDRPRLGHGGHHGFREGPHHIVVRRIDELADRREQIPRLRIG